MIILLLLGLLSSYTAYALEIADLPYLSDNKLAELKLRKSETPKFSFAAAAAWDPVLQSFRETDLERRFFDYISKEYGFVYHKRPGTDDTGKVTMYLLPDLGSFMQSIGATDPQLAQMAGGGANQRTTAVRFDAAYSLDRFPGSAARKAHIESTLLPMLIHEATHHVSFRRCDELLRARGGEYTIDSYRFGAEWFSEGFAENVPMAISPQVRALKYKQFKERFTDPGYKPEFNYLSGADGHEPDSQAKYLREVQDLYLAGAMMVEYLRLERGNAKIREFFEGVCTGKAQFSGMMIRSFGTTARQIWENTYERFKKKSTPEA